MAARGDNPLAADGENAMTVDTFIPSPRETKANTRGR
jgi:hypothetical protein